MLIENLQGLIAIAFCIPRSVSIMYSIFCCCFLALNMSTFYIGIIKVSEIVLMNSNKARERIMHSMNFSGNQLIFLWAVVKIWPSTGREWGQAIWSQTYPCWVLSIHVKLFCACQKENISAPKTKTFSLPECTEFFIWWWGLQ